MRELVVEHVPAMPEALSLISSERERETDRKRERIIGWFSQHTYAEIQVKKPNEYQGDIYI
jgi:hypothetical protein